MPYVTLKQRESIARYDKGPRCKHTMVLVCLVYVLLFEALKQHVSLLLHGLLRMQLGHAGLVLGTFPQCTCNSIAASLT